MPAVVIDGKALAQSIAEKLSAEVRQLTLKLGRAPGLAVILVGDNPASQVYVRSKTKKAKQCGINPTDRKLPATVSNAELLAVIRELNADSTVDGILLQLPLPAGLDEFQALTTIASEKDVDGLHPENQGLLLRGAKAPRPCTPRGCIDLLDQARKELGLPKDLSGLHAVVVGRSVLVGKPVGFLLLERNCTVTICHSKTKDLAAECRRADILIAAIGKPEFITADFIKPGAIVIDVGINRLDDERLVGDVAFESAAEIAAAITPVPGGVGPMTIATLLSNTVEAAKGKVKV